ncbi:ABC transporter permease [Chitinophaga arvensicola]|uniref:Duplicated orphan permease n=1 Tax=Chitinophaga arvensicola TaxID=29529 RepID=A0A1I0QCH3_9BACT|nr:ABC transporter permease [Chitinophaga arvensicola]SEW24277.1 duplicated orphan permease [Chitinophaga arvensicola]
MFKSYLKTAFRQLFRNKLFSSLNILGLATGMTCSILIFLWVQDERSYDTFNTHANNIYRLTARVGDIEAAVVPVPVAMAIREAVPGVKNVTRLSALQCMVSVGSQKYEEKNIYYADSNFLRIFSYPLLLGDATHLLAEPNGAVLTESGAKKYFGSPENAMGKTLHIDNDYNGNDVLITGVLKDLPTNSHLQFDLLLPIQLYSKTINLEQAWGNFDVYTYVQMEDRFSATPAALASLEQQIMAVYRRLDISKTQGFLYVQPLTAVHLHSRLMLDVPGQGSYQQVNIFSLIAIFILLIAGINFMNLSTALSSQRAKEVGLRKTVGAFRSQLVIQFLSEALVLSFISLILGLALAWLLMPLFNDLAGKSISINFLSIKLILSLVGIAVAVGLLSGSYPALFLSSFNPVKVLKGVKMLHGRKTFFRNSLIVVQFSIAVILMTGTIVVYKQLQFIRTMDIGYNKQNLLYVPIPRLGDLIQNQQSLRNVMGQYPEMDNYTFISHLPTNMPTGTKSVNWEGKDPTYEPIFPQMWVDDHFVNTFGMQLKSGRFFTRDFKEDEHNYVVNETALKVMKLNPENAVGTKMSMDQRNGVIVGVVKDFNFKPVQQPIQPLIIRHASNGDFNGNTGYIVLRTPPANVQRSIATMKKVFQQVYTDFPFSFGFVNDDLSNMYVTEQRMGKLFNIFSVLSVIVSCLGLFGLTTFATQKRIKEIGVRKVLGASVGGIVGMLSKDFVKLVVFALLIAFPVAWWVMNKWLQNFAYHISIRWWFFALAGMAALIISFITVSYQSMKAARTNPVKSLRSE